MSPIEIYQTYLKHFKLLESLEKWSAEDEQLLILLVDRYGDKYWTQISQYLEGKNSYMCFHTYHKRLNSNRVIRKWNIIEDYILALGTCVYRKENGKRACKDP